MRNAPKTGMQRLDPSSPTTLPAISEDSASFSSPRDHPPVPSRAQNRPSDKHFGQGVPPRFNHERSPPPYGAPVEDGPLEGESGEKLAELSGLWPIINILRNEVGGRDYLLLGLSWRCVLWD
jgi:hypothetical protein